MYVSDFECVLNESIGCEFFFAVFFVLPALKPPHLKNVGGNVGGGVV